MKAFDNLELWWVTGAQLLYGGDAVVAVDGHSKEMVAGLNDSGIIPIKVVYKGTANSSKEVEGQYELETGNVIVDEILNIRKINPDHTPAVLVKNHGPFSWGTSPDNAVYNAKVMEQCAKMAFVSFSVNPNTTMNPLLVEKHYSRKHGPNAYYGQKGQKH